MTAQAQPGRPSFLEDSGVFSAPDWLLLPLVSCSWLEPLVPLFWVLPGPAWFPGVTVALAELDSGLGA